jgi:hypothetical protein
VTQPGGEDGGFPMSSAASLAPGETCTEKNDARNERALLAPMKQPVQSACVIPDRGRASD